MSEPKTIHERAVHASFKRNCEEDVNYSSRMQSALLDIRRGDFGKRLTDCLWSPVTGFYEVEQVQPFLTMFDAIVYGQIAVVVFDVNAEPSPDRFREENHNKLQREDSCYEAAVTGAYDEDGWFKWTRQHEFIVFNSIENSDRIILQPKCIPLEIGTTKASRTLMHLRQDGAVARWPYGHRTVACFIVVDKNFSSMGVDDWIVKWK